MTMDTILHEKIDWTCTFTGVPVSSMVVWRECCPCEVEVQFHWASQFPVVSWKFARDLLADALLRGSSGAQVGLGDIVLSHRLVGEIGYLWVSLHSPSGHACFVTEEAENLAGFVSRGYEVVPRGAEIVDVDEVLARFFPPPPSSGWLSGTYPD